MKYVAVLSLALSVVCSSAFAESIKSIRKLPDGNNQIVYSLNASDSGSLTQYTLLDDDGMATLETVHLILIQDVSSQLWDHKLSWSSVASEKVENWQYAKALEKDALERLSHTDEAAVGASFALNLDTLRTEMAPFLDQDQVPTYDQLNQVGKFLEVYKGRFSYLVNGTHESLRDNDTDNPVGTDLSFRPMSLPPDSMSEGMSGGYLKFDIKTVFEKL